MIQYFILAPRTEGYELNGIDQITIYVEFALPLLLIVLVLNIVPLGAVIKQRRQDGNRQRFIEWMIVCIIWGVAIFTYGIAFNILEIVITLGKQKQ